MHSFKRILLISPQIFNLCSCAASVQQSKVIDKQIEIINNLTIPDLEYGQQYTSEPINLMLINVLKTNTYLKIINAQNSNIKVPNWIYINKENKIVIDKNNQLGKHFFVVYAYSDIDQVKSNDIKLSFSINKKTDLPDDLRVDLDPFVFFVGEKINFKLPITADVKDFNKDIYDFDVVVLPNNWPKSVDLEGNNLVITRKKDNDWFIEFSDHIDEKYVGSYNIDIFFVTSDQQKYVKSKHPVIVKIIKSLRYSDPNTNYKYLKFSRDGSWTLSLLKNGTSFIENVAEMIQGSWVTKIGNNLCKESNVKKLTTAFLPKTITEIGDYAFYDQQYLGHISMPNVEKIGKYTFYNCGMLMFDNDTKGICLKSIGEYCFYNAKKILLKNKQIITSIPDYSFAYSGVTDLIIADNCNYIGKAAFSMCQQLISLQFDAKTPPIIVDNPFFGCDKLKEIHVPKFNLQIYLQDKQWANIKQNLIGI